MGDHKEVRHLELFLKEPGGTKLRKTAAGRLQYLLTAGWRETERWQHEDHITVRVERTGHAPKKVRMPKPSESTRPPRQGWGQGGGRGGPGGRGGGGGRGGFGGGGRGGPPPTGGPPPSGGSPPATR